MTAAGYVTDVAYVPGFYPQMSPVAMRYVATLNGIIPPRTADGFRFLEVGCGLGRCLTTLAAARERLAPGGLLLVSYNAMPGWAHLQPIRGILRQYAALRTGDSGQRVRDAVAYLVFMRDKYAKYFEDNPRAAAYVDALVQQDPRYLVHEYMNEHWTSFYFAEVAGAFGQEGLSFVGSLPVHTNFWDLCVRPEFQELFRTTTSRLVAEAHKDFCANTAFRWDIYAKSPRGLKDVNDRLREVNDLHFRVVRLASRCPIRRTWESSPRR
jgi:hypothetical protein